MNKNEFAYRNDGATGVSRRDLLKGAAVSALGVGVMGALAGCAPHGAGDAPLADTGEGGGAGVYEATAAGLMGEVTVLVQADAESIKSITVTKCTDMPYEVCGHAVEQMPTRIVEAQTVDVDTVSGATMTSMAIQRAVTDALDQAGLSSQYSGMPDSAEPGSAEDVDVDVLVIGGGGSGIMAALTAKYENLDAVDSGVSVMLAEKLDFLGGSMLLSGGGTMTSVPLNESHIDDPVYAEPLYEYFQSRNTGEINREFIHGLWSVAGDTLMKLERLGGPHVTTGAYNDISTYEGEVPIMTAIRPLRPANAVFRAQNEHTWMQAGVQIIEFFNRWLPESGVDIRLNTAFDELLVEDGAVVGAHLVGPEGAYNVHAKKVILACGGFARNSELVKKYAPAYEGIIPFVNGGATGDAFPILEELGAEVVGDGMIAYIGTDSRYGMWPDLGQPYFQGTGNFMVVNSQGQRFVRDGAGYDLYRVTEGIVAQPDKTAYAIIDADNPDFELTDMSTMTEYKWKADTLEDLAAQLNMPADALVATVDAYNAAYDAGTTDEFETEAANILPIRKAPFYAVVCNPIAIGSLAGARCNEHCQVLAGGEPIPNLYAVGELIFGGNVETTYTGGLSNATALYTGRMAAEHAKQSLA